MRIGTRLAKRTILEAGNFRVPVGESIESGTIVQQAMDNFDHDENTMSGENGSHDTIFILFQNNDLDKPPQDIIQNVPENLETTEKERYIIYFHVSLSIKQKTLVKEAKLQMTLLLLVSLSMRSKKYHRIIFSYGVPQDQNFKILQCNWYRRFKQLPVSSM